MFTKLGNRHNPTTPLRIKTERYSIINILIKVLTVLLLSIVNGQKVDDEVKSLPGQSFQTLNCRMYSGYFNVSKTRHLHYMFVESLDKPETDPVLVYFNGGPGAASIHLNFLYFGPYVSLDGSSNLKPWAFFLEQACKHSFDR